MAYVYRHIRLDKNEPFYIGIGGLSKFDYYKRSKTKSNRGKIWRQIANKVDYRIDIILDDLSEQEAKQKEIELIALYGRIDKKTGILANLTDGGDGVVGMVISEDTKIKIIESRKGFKHTFDSIEKIKKNHFSKQCGYVSPMIGKQPWNKGKKASKDAIRNQSESQKMLYKNGYINPNSKLVINTQNGFVYNSATEAWKASGLKYSLSKYTNMLNGHIKNNTLFQYA